MTTATDLNTHLSNGGAVRVSTMAHATVYDTRHSGAFSEDAKGILYVKHGNRSLRLGPTKQPYVGIQLSRLPS